MCIRSQRTPATRQRCLTQRMRNLAVKVPTDLWPEFKARVTACYQAPSRAIARDLANGIRADYATRCQGDHLLRRRFRGLHRPQTACPTMVKNHPERLLRVARSRA
jgi:hypothetical protein